MRKITREDIVENERYLKEREERLRSVIELKKRRRLSVGENISLVFENRRTVISQIQEMMRVERISEERAIQAEIDVYNDLIPDRNELSATLFIEVEDMSRIKPVLDRMIGLDETGVLTLRVGEEHTVPALFEEGHSEEDRISAVHYLRFPFTAQAREAFADPSRKAALLVEHPNYRVFAVIPDGVRAELLQDLSGDD